MNNICIALGRLTKTPELKYTTNGKKISEITLAIPNQKDDTTFINIMLFGNVAEALSRYCSKGDMIGCMYKVHNNNWEDKEGKKHYEYKFIGNKISFLSTKKTNNTDNTKEVTKEEEVDLFQEFANEIEVNESMLPF